jgi:hypothetical protein
VSVVSHIPSPIHHAIPVPCVVTPHLSFTCACGPCPWFPVPMLLVPPSFSLFGPCHLSFPCMWCAPSPSWSWSWSLHPPSTLQAVACSGGGGVLGCGSGHSPHASCFHHPIIPIPGAPCFHPMSSCLWQRFGMLLCWQTWVLFGYRVASSDVVG